VLLKRKASKIGVVVQVVEPLPNKHETLSSNPSTTTTTTNTRKKKKKKKERKERLPPSMVVHTWNPNVWGG
jgi:hypothetical protein